MALVLPLLPLLLLLQTSWKAWVPHTTRQQPIP
jgi:hypothetical protein